MAHTAPKPHGQRRVRDALHPFTNDAQAGALTIAVLISGFARSYHNGLTSLREHIVVPNQLEGSKIHVFAHISLTFGTSMAAAWTMTA